MFVFGRTDPVWAINTRESRRLATGVSTNLTRIEFYL